MLHLPGGGYIRVSLSDGLGSRAKMNTGCACRCSFMGLTSSHIHE